MHVYSLETKCTFILHDYPNHFEELQEKFNLEFINFTRQLRLLRLSDMPITLSEQQKLVDQLMSICNTHNVITGDLPKEPQSGQ